MEKHTLSAGPALRAGPYREQDLTPRGCPSQNPPPVDREGLAKELGEWLSEKLGADRQVFLTTWTFAPRSEQGLPAMPGLQYVNKARERLAKKLDAIDASAFITTERGTYGERLHLHSLSDNANQLAYAERWWRSLYGFVKRSSPCDARTGAAMYVAKYVTKSTGALVAPQFSAVGPRFPTVNLATA